MAEQKNSNPMANPINADVPRSTSSMVANQRMWQGTSNESFYSMMPAAYNSFYRNWVQQWLYWYDGFVPYIHGGPKGILSTGIGTTIVNRCADSVVGGNFLFTNASTPSLYREEGGKKIGVTLDFIANKWVKQADVKAVLKKFVKYVLAGGFALLKVNVADGEAWLDTLRADRFYVDKAGDTIRKCLSIIAFYDAFTERENSKRYVLLEERRYEEMGLFAEEIPVVEYKMYDTSVPIQYMDSVKGDSCVKWEQLPKEVRKALKAEYGSIRLNEPRAMNGFRDLGCYIGNASEGVSNVPNVGLGESILANIMTYLYEFDFYNTCFNTDMYLARGRVIVPKPMQGQGAKNGGFNTGLDEFLYTQYETPNAHGDFPKPEAIQFALRATEWKEARNLLLESIATSIGISVSTLASYLNDGSNRTAREISAEENATTLFVENMRMRLEIPINAMLHTVVQFYGLVDDVKVLWIRSGMTNQMLMVEVLSQAKAAGLISAKKAHDMFNYTSDEEQNAEDYALVQQDMAQAQNSLFGLGDGT